MSLAPTIEEEVPTLLDHRPGEILSHLYPPVTEPDVRQSTVMAAAAEEEYYGNPHGAPRFGAGYGYGGESGGVLSSSDTIYQSQQYDGLSSSYGYPHQRDTIYLSQLESVGYYGTQVIAPSPESIHEEPARMSQQYDNRGYDASDEHTFRAEDYEEEEKPGGRSQQGSKSRRGKKSKHSRQDSKSSRQDTISEEVAEEPYSGAAGQGNFRYSDVMGAGKEFYYEDNGSSRQGSQRSSGKDSQRSGKDSRGSRRDTDTISEEVSVEPYSGSVAQGDVSYSAAIAAQAARGYYNSPYGQRYSYGAEVPSSQEDVSYSAAIAAQAARGYYDSSVTYGQEYSVPPSQGSVGYSGAIAAQAKEKESGGSSRRKGSKSNRKDSKSSQQETGDNVVPEESYDYGTASGMPYQGDPVARAQQYGLDYFAGDEYTGGQERAERVQAEMDYNSPDTSYGQGYGTTVTYEDLAESSTQVRGTQGPTLPSAAVYAAMSRKEQAEIIRRYNRQSSGRRS